MLPFFFTKVEEKADVGRERTLLPSWAMSFLKAKCLVDVVPGIKKSTGLGWAELCWVHRQTPFTATSGKLSMGCLEYPRDSKS